MRKFIKTIFAVIIILAIILNYTAVLAEPPEKPSGEIQSQNGGTPPDKPDGDGNTPRNKW